MGIVKDTGANLLSQRRSSRFPGDPDESENLARAGSAKMIYFSLMPPSTARQRCAISIKVIYASTKI